MADQDDLNARMLRRKKARAAWLDRALKIACISPEAEKAAKNAELDRNQSALLKIVESDDPFKQLETIEEIKRTKTASKKKEVKKFLNKTIRFPADRKKEVLEKLATFVDELGIDVI